MFAWPWLRESSGVVLRCLSLSRSNIFTNASLISSMGSGIAHWLERRARD